VANGTVHSPAGSGSASAAPGSTSIEERIAAQRRCVARHIELENIQPGDTMPRAERVAQLLRETFLPESAHPYYDVTAGTAHFSGVGEIGGFYDMLFAFLPDLRFWSIHDYDVPGCSIRELIVVGTHSAEGVRVSSATTRSGSLAPGSGLSSTERIQLKMVVLAPMPMAMVRIATAPKPGFLHNMRKL